jgi:hypothetical protein
MSDVKRNGAIIKGSFGRFACRASIPASPKVVYRIISGSTSTSASTCKYTIVYADSASLFLLISVLYTICEDLNTLTSVSDAVHLSPFPDFVPCLSLAAIA